LGTLQIEILKMYSKTLEWEAIPLMDFKSMGLKIRRDVYP
jgi:hypothetical protein